MLQTSSPPLWNLWEVARITSGIWTDSRLECAPISNVSHNPANAGPGTLFFVIDQDAWGRDYTNTISAAVVEARASAAVITASHFRELQSLLGAQFQIPLLVVENSFKALCALAQAARDRFRG